MSTGFDPYHKWLGIPPAEQPPHHYRLLAIRPYESDPDVIEGAADRLMAHLRTFQSGKNGALSQKLLNEVSAARLCLLSAGRRAAYDEELRKRFPDLETTEPDGAFGQYLLLDQLDATKTGQLLKAKHRAMGRIVALKILSREAMASRQFRERFQQKVKILAQLQHPHLVAAYEAGERAGSYFLVMEYVDGRDLWSMVKESGPLPIDTAVDYLTQAADGLAYAHQHGIFHRNVKPANLMVDHRGVIKVVGLGLARVDADSDLAEEGGERLTRMGQVMGTYEYMPPEQAFDSSRVDARCDVYSLGGTLHALLTGRPPYAGKGDVQLVMAHRSQPIPSLCKARPETPAWLDRVFQKMLAKEPADRYQSMDEVLTALRDGGVSAEQTLLPVEDLPEPFSVRTTTLRRGRPARKAQPSLWRHPAIISVVVGAVVVVVLVLLTWLQVR